MELHRNAKLGLAGRFALVQAREAGLPVREVARRFSVSVATVSRWSSRWLQASPHERASLKCLHDRSSRPRRMPRLLAGRRLETDRRLTELRDRSASLTGARNWSPTVRARTWVSAVARIRRRRSEAGGELPGAHCGWRGGRATRGYPPTSRTASSRVCSSIPAPERLVRIRPRYSADGDTRGRTRRIRTPMNRSSPSTRSRLGPRHRTRTGSNFMRVCRCSSCAGSG